jgi:predicted NUDIX family phosphoesterase
MNTQTQPTTPVYNSMHDELILVVPRAAFAGIDSWHGLIAADNADYAQLIEKNKEFLPRSQMETDASYKQIIPYLIYTHDGKYFLMQRQPKASETRLQSKYSLGIGGHIRQEDIQGADIATWARREFEEEVIFNGSYTIEPLGLLNDDTNDVGKVHIGFVFLLHGDSADINVQEELKSGTLLTLDECKILYSSMETWSQIIVDHLDKK